MARQLGLAIGLIALVSCQPGDDPGPAADQSAPVLEGRGFDVVLYGGAEATTTKRVIFGAEGRLAENVIDIVDGWCGAELDLDGRFGTSFSNYPECGVLAVRAQQERLCRGHMLQTLADTIAPMDFFVGGFNGLADLDLRSLGAITMRTREPGDAPALPSGELPAFTITPPSASDAATLSLAATVAFQHGALIGANAVDRFACRDGTLYGSVSASRDEEGVWAEEQTPMAFVLLSGTNEALQEMHGCAEAASRYIAAAAEQHLATDRDTQRARVQAFRGRHDSRLEIANLYVGVGLDLMEPTSDGLIIELTSGTVDEGEGGLPPCATRARGTTRSVGPRI